LVVLFTCFPYAYAPLSVALFVPLHLALVGIVLRGAAFIFRGYERKEVKISTWRVMFGVASVITPVLLGMAFGAVTAGGIQVARGDSFPPYLRPYSIGCGLLALSACAYLAAVYLTVETDAALREDFRRRAIVAGTSTFILAGVVLVLAWWEARWFFDQLTSGRALPATAAGILLFAASAWAVFGRRYKLGRVFAAGEIVLLLLGWGLAQKPYLVYPSMKLTEVAGPAETIRFLLLSLPVGAAVLVPSLWLMFRVFKADDTIG
jgi:cytochrome bd ubiquinol oxidase subunit II